MSPFFTAYLERLTTLHNDILTVLDRLPQSALDWKPDTKMNSIAMLIAHTAGAETFWIGDMIHRCLVLAPRNGAYGNACRSCATDGRYVGKITTLERINA